MIFGFLAKSQYADLIHDRISFTRFVNFGCKNWTILVIFDELSDKPSAITDLDFHCCALVPQCERQSVELRSSPSLGFTVQKAKCGIGVSPAPFPLRIPHFGQCLGLASALDAARILSLGCCVAGHGS